MARLIDKSEQEQIYVNSFSDEEMDDFASALNSVIETFCKFSDKHNFDRDNIIAFVAEKLQQFSEFATVKNYEVREQPAIDPLRHGYVLSSVHEQVQWERDIAIDQLHSYGVEFGEKAEMQRVKHGKWMLKAYKEPSNYRWNVKAECSECCDEEKEIWAGFFPDVPDWLARDVAIQYAEEVKMSNYCQNCGAKMDKE